tara:strand:+ start:216 stop:323 length:108 start_codon:yes stop_codon:yes gene_type:complete
MSSSGIIAGPIRRSRIYSFTQEDKDGMIENSFYPE